MGKKARRIKKKGRQVRLSPAQMARPVARERDETAPAALVGLAPGQAGLREDYRHVVADLKRIGVIAAAALALVIVLAVVLA